jgi:hypothetical protein
MEGGGPPVDWAALAPHIVGKRPAGVSIEKLYFLASR